MASFHGLDIFGVPLEYSLERTRKMRFTSYISKLAEYTKTDISKTFKNSQYEIYNCVFLGFLSFQSASYFLLGRFTPAQDDFLRSFNDFLLSNNGCSVSKIHVLWQDLKKPVPANTFLSPLVAPVSNVSALYDFSKERERYYLQGKQGLIALQRDLFIDSFDDLPPDNAVMPSAD